MNRPPFWPQVIHPLSWPPGWKRTEVYHRSDGARFGRVTLADAN